MPISCFLHILRPPHSKMGTLARVMRDDQKLTHGRYDAIVISFAEDIIAKIPPSFLSPSVNVYSGTVSDAVPKATAVLGAIWEVFYPLSVLSFRGRGVVRIDARKVVFQLDEVCW